MKIYLSALVYSTFIIVVSCRLEPTKIVDNGVYKLEIQSEDKFLTGVEKALPIRSIWKNKPEQKWRFQKTKDPTTNEDAWKIAPVNNVGGLDTLWKIAYVGHGKYRFTSTATGMCLHGQGSTPVIEFKCDKDHPGQRWLVLETNE